MISRPDFAAGSSGGRGSTSSAFSRAENSSSVNQGLMSSIWSASISSASIRPENSEVSLLRLSARARPVFAVGLRSVRCTATRVLPSVGITSTRLMPWMAAASTVPLPQSTTPFSSTTIERAAPKSEIDRDSIPWERSVRRRALRGSGVSSARETTRALGLVSASSTGLAMGAS